MSISTTLDYKMENNMINTDILYYEPINILKSFEEEFKNKLLEEIVKKYNDPLYGLSDEEIENLATEAYTLLSLESAAETIEKE